MKHIWPVCIALAILVGLFGSALASAKDRPRVIVLTDYFKDPDDKQSMVRFLSAANEFDVEGLIATSLAYGDGAVHPEWIHEIIDAYGKALPNLRLHERDGYGYPSAESLHAVVKAGAPVIRTYVGRNKGFPVPYPPGARDARQCAPAEEWIGDNRDTSASQHIIEVVDRDDPRPVWVVVWGGAMDLAQALWTVRHDRTAEETERFVRKLRVYQISWQDTGVVWLWENFPQLRLIQSETAFRGIYAEGPSAMRDEAWGNANVRNDHGPLGAAYPRANVRGIKEGDTPSFLGLIGNGLSDPEHPEWGGWGGRFRRLDPARSTFVDALDSHPDSTDRMRRAQWTVGRWNVATSNDLAARMDWCVRRYDEANHHPIAVVDGDATKRVLHRDVRAGEVVLLDAAGTRDPDGDSLTFQWWHHAEAGSCDGMIRLASPDTRSTQLAVPTVDRPCEIHIILEATDDGVPPLTSYRRIVFTVRPPK